MTSTAEDVVARVGLAIGSADAPLHEPDLGGMEAKYVSDCIRSTFVSSVSPYVERFENAIAEATGARHVLATNTGTSALHLALLVAGVKPGDEVLCTSMSFVATANAISYCDATPHFVDVEEETFGMSPQALESTLAGMKVSQDGGLINPRTGAPVRAVLPVHVFGHPCQIEQLTATADRYSIPLVEDAAEALGSRSGNGQHAGTFGAMGCLSFNGNKIATTGAGGALISSDSELIARARHLASLAKIPHRWKYEHTGVGYNYRMPGINAAIGCAQLERLTLFLERKSALHLSYQAAFRNFELGMIHKCSPRVVSNFWLNTLVLKAGMENQLHPTLYALNERGWGARPVWQLLPDLPQFSGAPRGDLSCARQLADRIINLPSGSQLSGRFSPRDEPFADR